MTKPTCKVRGRVAPGAMCGHIIVGMTYCGYNGDCEHKIALPPPPNCDACQGDGSTDKTACNTTPQDQGTPNGHI